MAGVSGVRLQNGGTAAVEEVPVVAMDLFRRSVIDAVAAGGRITALFGVPGGRGTALFALLARDSGGELALIRSEPVGQSYPALTPECPQAHLFEREIAEQHGLVPEGHPWLKPVRVAPPGVIEFFTVRGDEAHEVAVGPVHAGIIEPGHFRFQCHGERVLFLEIALGYQTRGVERALRGAPDRRTIHYMETLAGDTSIGHAWAYAQAMEALGGAAPPPRAQALRGVALELERVANHVGDLGALANDVGYLPTASFCGRLRGEFLNLTAGLCGSRLGRGLVRPGGVGFDLRPEEAGNVRDQARAALREVADASGLLWGTATVRARFEETGTLSRQACETLGVVGPAARASGLPRDVRADFPTGPFREHPIEAARATTGDVQGRAWVRWLEIQRSVGWLSARLADLPSGPVRCEVGPPAPGTIAVSLIEGWRGEICHIALTDPAGRFHRYKVVDPSFHNWIGLAVAMRDQPISDFPLCNKSFNLSYCGHDL